MCQLETSRKPLTIASNVRLWLDVNRTTAISTFCTSNCRTLQTESSTSPLVWAGWRKIAVINYNRSQSASPSPPQFPVIRSRFATRSSPLCRSKREFCSRLWNRHRSRPLRRSRPLDFRRRERGRRRGRTDRISYGAGALRTPKNARRRARSTILLTSKKPIRSEA